MSVHVCVCKRVCVCVCRCVRVCVWGGPTVFGSSADEVCVWCVEWVGITEASLEPRPSSPRFHLGFSPRLQDKIWARKAWAQGYTEATSYV